MNENSEVVISKLKHIVVLSLLFMVVELIGGYYAHSVAIFADAFHLLSDVIAYSISLGAVYMSHYPKPRVLTFGFENIQPFGAFINVILIWLVTVELLVQASKRIVRQSIVEQPLYMLITSLFGLLCNLYILYILHSDEHGAHRNCNHKEMHQLPHRHGKQHSPKYHQDDLHSHHSNQSNSKSCASGHRKQNHKPFEDRLLQACGSGHNANNIENNINIKAAYIHILTDIILSIGVIISAIVIYFCAPQHRWSFWQLADPICTYLFSFLAIYSTLPVLKQSAILLLNGCNNAKIIDQIQYQLKNNEIVQEIQSLKLWETGNGSLYGAVRLRVKKGNRSGLLNVFSDRKIDGFVHFLEEEALVRKRQQ